MPSQSYTSIALKICLLFVLFCFYGVLLALYYAFLSLFALLGYHKVVSNVSAAQSRLTEIKGHD